MKISKKAKWIIAILVALTVGITITVDQINYDKLEGNIGGYSVYAGPKHLRVSCSMVRIWDSLVITTDIEYGFNESYDSSTCNTSIYIRKGLRKMLVQEAYDSGLISLEDILSFNYGRDIEEGIVFDTSNVIKIEVYDERDGELIFSENDVSEFDFLLSDFDSGFVPLSYPMLGSSSGFMILYTDEGEHYFELYSLFIRLAYTQNYLYVGFQSEGITVVIDEILYGD